MKNRSSDLIFGSPMNIEQSKKNTLVRILVGTFDKVVDVPG